MSQNLVIKGDDNPVVMTFTFTGEFLANGLSEFTEITVDIGGELYSTVNDAANLFLNGNLELRLKIGDTTTLTVGSYLPEIHGISATYDDGYLLSGTNKIIIGEIYVVE